MMRRCRVPAEELVLYGDGLLPEGRIEIVEAHLAVCPHCQMRLARYREVDRLIQSESRIPTPALGQRSALRQRLSDEAIPGSLSAAYRPGKLITGITVAVLLLMMVYPSAIRADAPWRHIGLFAERSVTEILPTDEHGSTQALTGSSHNTTSLEFAPAAPTELPAGSFRTGQAIVGVDRNGLPFGQGSDADGDGFYTSAEFQAAITALFVRYEWPPAYTPDVDTAASRFGEGELADVLYGVPGEYTVVGGYYVCAWGQAWLDAFAVGDLATMDASLRRLRAELAWNPIESSQADRHHRNMYDQASLGDPVLLRRHVDVNCAGRDWLGQSHSPWDGH